jgi:hypothetical protein
MIVEFMGLSGAGKSSLVSAVRDLLAGDACLVDASRDVPHDGYRATLATHPLLSARIIGRAAARSRGRCFRTATGRLLMMGAVRQQVALQAAPGVPVILLEEGVIHYVWRKQMTLGEDLAVEVLERTLPHLADAVIHVEVSPEVARSRISGKPNIGSVQRRLLAHELGSPVWERATSTYRVLDAAVRAGLEPGRYLRVDNEHEDLQVTAGRVAEHLRGLLAPAPEERAR